MASINQQQLEQLQLINSKLQTIDSRLIIIEEKTLQTYDKIDSIFWASAFMSGFIVTAFAGNLAHRVFFK